MINMGLESHIEYFYSIETVFVRLSQGRLKNLFVLLFRTLHTAGAREI